MAQCIQVGISTKPCLAESYGGSKEKPLVCALVSTAMLKELAWLLFCDRCDIFMTCKSHFFLTLNGILGEIGKVSFDDDDAQ